MKIAQLVKVFLQLLSRMFSNMVYVHKVKSSHLFGQTPHTAMR